MADDQIRSENEEIRDILIAISVIAKRLATKLESKMKSIQEEDHERKERSATRD